MANVNVINKNNTDYYFEDTAGRNLTATKQDDSLVAVKAYAIGDFFWYNDKLYNQQLHLVPQSYLLQMQMKQL